MKNTLWIIPIEPIETRYTKHWYEHMPRLFGRNIKNYVVEQLEIDWRQTENTEGAFLNFADTSLYKSIQLSEISRLFSRGMIQPNDVFLFMDYWNPCANMVRYMSVLLNIPVKLLGICHAGNWDEYDILGQKFKDNFWIHDVEMGLDTLYDYKFFATEFSRSLYEHSIPHSDNNIVTGFPMEYFYEIETPYWGDKNAPEKENIILFPHRKSPEKQLDVFYELERRLPEYEFIVSLDVCGNKQEYHELLRRSRLCFSASLQETLGISIGLEALYFGCDVFVPNRLSYKEMFKPNFKYDGNMLKERNYSTDLDAVSNMIRNRIENPTSMVDIKQQLEDNFRFYFSGDRMYKFIDGLAKSTENDS